MANPTGVGGFQPGESGNPRGRPRKDESLSDLLRKQLRIKGPDGKPNRTVILERLIGMARNGDINAIRVVLERADGKIPQALDVTSGGEPLAPFAVIIQEVSDRGDDDPPAGA